MSEVKKFTFDVGWVFGSSIITLILAFPINIIIGRLLGAEGLGLYAMTMVIYGIAMLFFGFGINAAVVKFVAEHKGDRDKLNQVITNGLLNSFILGFFGIIILYSLSSNIANIFNMQELEGLIKLISFVIPFAIINQLNLGVLNGLRIMRSYSMVIITQSVLMLVSVILLIYLGFGIKGAILGVLFSVFFAFLLSLFFAKKFFNFDFNNYMENTKKLLTFGFPLLSANILNLTNARIDVLLLGYFLTEREIGVYAIATMFLQLMLMIPMAIQKITYPAISYYYGKKNHNAIESMINKCIKYTLIFLLIGGVVLAFLSGDIIRLLFPHRPEFLEGILPLIILLFMAVFRGPTASVGASFTSVGKPEIPLKIETITVLTAVISGIVLIPLFGIVGAASTVAISKLMPLSIYPYLMKRYVGVRIQMRLYGKIIFIGCAISLFILLFKNIINNYILAIIASVLYLILLYLTKVITKEDKAMVQKILPRRINKII